MDLGEWLSTKRAGVPTWLWVFGGVALLSIGVLYYRQKKAAATATPDTGSGAGTTASIPTGGAAYPMPYSGGDVYVNTPAPTTQPPTNIPSAITDLVQGNYVVKGVRAPNGIADNYPAGLAQIVYGLPSSDIIDESVDSTMIVLANPGKITPWPTGTAIAYPLNPQKLMTATPQTSSMSFVGSTGNNPTNTASGQ